MVAGATASTGRRTGRHRHHSQQETVTINGRSIHIRLTTVGKTQIKTPNESRHDRYHRTNTFVVETLAVYLQNFFQLQHVAYFIPFLERLNLAKTTSSHSL